jgi:endonuclease YncB( thermonuclease family)
MSKEYRYEFNDEQPKEGATLKVYLERVVDGDTVEATVSFKIKVRLIGVNAPEKKKPGWLKFKNRLKELIWGECFDDGESSDWQEATLFIPNNKPVTLLDVVTFDRILGEIWVDGENINAILEEEIQNFKRET